jgi:hypothetical protein
VAGRNQHVPQLSCVLVAAGLLLDLLPLSLHAGFLSQHRPVISGLGVDPYRTLNHCCVGLRGMFKWCGKDSAGWLSCSQILRDLGATRVTPLAQDPAQAAALASCGLEVAPTAAVAAAAGHGLRASGALAGAPSHAQSFAAPHLGDGGVGGRDPKPGPAAAVHDVTGHGQAPIHLPMDGGQGGGLGLAATVAQNGCHHTLVGVAGQ